MSASISETNSQFYHNIKAIKDAKFATLLDVAPSSQNAINRASAPQKRTVLIIPDDVPLTASENSVLRKSLTFVAVNSKTNKYQVITDCVSSIFATYVSRLISMTAKMHPLSLIMILLQSLLTRP